MLETSLANVQAWALVNTRSAFPFAAGGDALSDTDPRTIVVDAYVAGQFADLDLSTPLTVTLTPSGGTFTLLVTQGAVTVFDSSAVPSARFAQNTWGTWRVVEWYVASPFALFRFTLDDTRLPAVCGGDLLPSRVNRRAAKVLSIIADGDTATGSVVLEEGYNTQIEVAQTAKGATLRVNCIPGSGAGRSTDCEKTSDDQIRAINGVGPDRHGNFMLQGDGACYWVTVPMETVGIENKLSAAKVAISNNCQVCCACSDYVDAYNTIRTLQANLLYLRTGVTNLQTKYTQLYDWYTLVTTGMRVVRSDVHLYAKPGWRVLVQVVVRNSTLERIEGGMSVVTTMASTAGLELVPASAYAYTPQGQKTAIALSGSGTYTATITQPLGPGETATVEFELYFTDARAAGAAVSAAAQATWPTGTTTESTASTTLVAPFNL